MQKLVVNLVRWRYCTEVFDYLALAALIEVGASLEPANQNTVCSFDF